MRTPRVSKLPVLDYGEYSKRLPIMKGTDGERNAAVFEAWHNACKYLKSGNPYYAAISLSKSLALNLIPEPPVRDWLHCGIRSWINDLDKRKNLDFYLDLTTGNNVSWSQLMQNDNQRDDAMVSMALLLAHAKYVRYRLSVTKAAERVVTQRELQISHRVLAMDYRAWPRREEFEVNFLRNFGDGTISDGEGKPLKDISDLI